MGVVEKRAPTTAPHLPPALGCTAQEGRRDVSELPYCPGEQVQRPPPPVPAVQEGSTPEPLQPLHYLQVSVVVGRHTETASPPPVPVMRTGCTESLILAAVGAPLQADSSGSAQLPLSSCTGRIHGTQAKSSVLLAARARTGGLAQDEHGGCSERPLGCALVALDACRAGRSRMVSGGPEGS